jgi:hypothetical protein
MENHALHGDGIYYESADTVWVNLFAPSTAALHNGMRLTMESDFPDGDHASIKLSGHAARPFALAIRRPGWAGDGFVVRVNGERVEVPTMASQRVGGAGGRDLGLDEGMLPPSSFVTIERAWKAGDVVDLTMPKTLRLEPTDDRSVAAIMWGPLVLAGDLGPRREREERRETPKPTSYALVASGRPLEEWVVPTGERAGNFTASGVGRSFDKPNDAPTDVALAPFYRTQERTYSVYFDVLTPAEFDAHVAARAAEAEREHRLELATVAFVQPGNATDEQKFNYHSEPADRVVTRTDGRTGRGGTGWFSFDVPVDPNADTSLVVTYRNDLGLPVLANFSIRIDGVALARYTPNRSATTFWDEAYPLPATLLKARNQVTVRFEAGANGRIAPVYGIRTIRAKVA